MFGCSFSNAFTAACVAVPSAPKPWVANTVVCVALAATCLPAELGPLLQPAAASVATVPTATAITAARFLRRINLWGDPVRAAHLALPGHFLNVATSFASGPRSGSSLVRGRLRVIHCRGSLVDPVLRCGQGGRVARSGGMPIANRRKTCLPAGLRSGSGARPRRTAGGLARHAQANADVRSYSTEGRAVHQERHIEVPSGRSNSGGSRRRAHGSTPHQSWRGS